MFTAALGESRVEEFTSSIRGSLSAVIMRLRNEQPQTVFASRSNSFPQEGKHDVTRLF